LLMTAVAGPLTFTAASAHPAAPGGRAAARMTILASADEAQVDPRLARLGLSGPAPAQSPGPSSPALATPMGAPSAPSAPRPGAERAPVVGGGGHFSFGWCTWYVSSRRYVPWMGNAIEWLRNAAAMGYPEGQTPRVGAIMVTRESGWGHVAYVESVDSNGAGWTVSEMNFRGFGVVDTRHISAGRVPVVGFIY